MTGINRCVRKGRVRWTKLGAVGKYQTDRRMVFSKSLKQGLGLIPPPWQGIAFTLAGYGLYKRLREVSQRGEQINIHGYQSLHSAPSSIHQTTQRAEGRVSADVFTSCRCLENLFTLVVHRRASGLRFVTCHGKGLCEESSR